MVFGAHYKFPQIKNFDRGTVFAFFMKLGLKFAQLHRPFDFNILDINIFA